MTERAGMKDSGYLLHLVHTAMVGAGFDVAAIFEQLGYDAEKYGQREVRTPHDWQAAFWQTVERVSGDPDVGLHLCPHLPVFHGDVLNYLFFSSPTFGDGIRRAGKFLRLVSDALQIQLVESRPRACIEVADLGEIRSPHLRHNEICTAYSLIHFARSVTERRFDSTLVELRCEPRSAPEEYARIFGCEVQLGRLHTRIHFDATVLDHRSPHGDPELLRLHEELAVKRLSHLERQDLIERINKVFAQRLELEHCELEDVARALNLAPRRLRFELSRAGTSFSQLLNDFRYSLARRLLARTDERIENIVYLTGFSEPSTFYRAFKRWSGLTPVQFREQRRKGEAPAPVAAIE